MTDTPGRDPDVLTTAELAAKLGLSPQTVRRMANAEQIPALKTGKDFRYSWEPVRDVLRQPHHQPGEAANDPTDQPESKKGAGYRVQRRARTSGLLPHEAFLDVSLRTLAARSTQSGDYLASRGPSSYIWRSCPPRVTAEPESDDSCGCSFGPPATPSAGLTRVRRPWRSPPAQLPEVRRIRDELDILVTGLLTTLDQ